MSNKIECCINDKNEVFITSTILYNHYIINDNNEWEIIGEWDSNPQCEDLCIDCYNEAKKKTKEELEKLKSELKKEVEGRQKNKKCKICGTSKNIHQIEKKVLFQSNEKYEEFLIFVRVICSDCWTKNVYPNMDKTLYKYVGW